MVRRHLRRLDSQIDRKPQRAKRLDVERCLLSREPSRRDQGGHSQQAKFERARLAFASSRTAADFAEWRDQRDWTAWKYRMRDAGLPMPAQSVSGRARCFCEAEITTASVSAHVRIAHQEIST
jgi:hypothetical protein